MEPAFSILCRIEGVETQRLGPELEAQAAFSILCRIEGVETLYPAQSHAPALVPFSILCRIEGVETLDLVQAGVFGLNFQYPLSDRRG